MRCTVSMQNEITNSSKLLDESGNLVQKGWARKPLLEYNRDKIASSWARIKEWDYYAILNDDFGITFTLTDLGLMGLFNITWLDFKDKKFYVSEDLKLLTRGKTNLPHSSTEGNVSYHGKKMKLEFERHDEHRIIRFEDPRFQKKLGIKGELRLDHPKAQESMVIATPWKNKSGKFYYNEKVNCQPASGEVKIGNDSYEFNNKTSFGVLDWGRGVWPYSDTWYWGSASGIVNGSSFGFNIGHGFGDLSMATENMVFVNGKGHKLNEVKFNIDSKDYLKPWTFTSDDGRFEMSMKPILDRNATVNLLIFKSSQHQIFGRFSGFVLLDDGSKFEVNDLLGFAEKVSNRW